MFVRTLAQHSAQRVNGLREVALFDDDVRPQLVHQGLLVEELPGALDEIQQGVEYLSSDLQRLAIDTG